MPERPLGIKAIFVLGALAESPSHGYGISKRVETITNGQVKLRPGTCYPLLERLHHNGLIELAGISFSKVGHRRSEFALTDAGRAALRNHLDLFSRLNEVVNGVAFSVPDPIPDPGSE